MPQLPCEGRKGGSWPKPLGPETTVAQGIKVGEVGAIMGVGCVHLVSVVEHLLQPMQGVDMQFLCKQRGFMVGETKVFEGGGQGGGDGATPA